MKIYIDRDQVLQAIQVERGTNHTDKKTLGWCKQMVESQPRHPDMLQYLHSKGFFVALCNNVPEGWLLKVMEYASMGNRTFSWVEPDFDVLRAKVELDLNDIPYR
jgi:hypothetical protein